MADAVLTDVKDRLRYLVAVETNLPSPLLEEIGTLCDLLISLVSAIRHCQSREDDDMVGEWPNWSEVGELAYQLEHFVLQIEYLRKRDLGNILKKSVFFTCKAALLSNLILKLQTFEIRIRTHAVEIRKKTNQFSGYLQQGAAFWGRAHFLDNKIVGREEELHRLLGYMCSEDKRYRIVSIFGKSGLGKTAFANKVSDHSSILSYLENIACVRVKQKCHARIVLQDITKQLLPGKEDEITGLGDRDLVLTLYSLMKEKKCLVVLDDVCSMDAWNSIKIAFPMKQDTGSKILLTTRSEEVAAEVGFCHQLRVLDNKESWTLLMKCEYDQVLLDARTEKMGKELVKECGGHPEVIFLLRGLLQKKPPEEWRKVYDDVKSFTSGQSQEQKDETYSQLLSLTYQDLPPNLQLYFLYLGHFREDSEIEAEKLYQCWLAEGLLDADLFGKRAATAVAEDYLRELAIKSMVQVKIDESGEGFACCSVNYIQRQLSLRKGKEKGLQAASSTPRVRRLARYFDTGEERNAVPQVEDIFDLRGLEFLNILDFEGFDFRKRKLPKGIEELILLRFLSFRGCYLPELPSSISNLRYLQTLDLRVNGRIFVPNVLCKMIELRYLYLPNILVTMGSKLRLSGLSLLEILKCFNMSMCEVENFYSLENLQKLDASTEGNDEDLKKIIMYLRAASNRLPHLSIKISAWDCYSSERLALLRELFGCQTLCSLNVEGRIKLPEYNHISTKLSELVLDGSELEEDPMATLENLPSLRSLSLIGEVMVGEKMVCSADGFRKLGTLRLRDIPYLKSWEVHAGAMPSLSYLEVHACKKLKMFPKELRSKTTFLKLKITDMPESFKNKIPLVDAEGEDFLKVSTSSIPSTITTVSSFKSFCLS